MYKKYGAILLFSCFTASIVFGQGNEEISANLKNHIYYLSADSLDGRGLSTPGHTKAGIYIAGLFSDIGLKPFDEDYYHEFDLRIELVSITGKNVIGIIEGSDPVLKNEYIVVGAHYDHLGYEVKNNEKIIYNGADDNASGVAGIMEIAKILMHKKETLRRSVVIVAFDAEESGLKGAEAFVSQNNMIPAASVKAMFSLDMIGMYDAYEGLDLKGIGSIKGGSEMARELAKNMTISLKDTSDEIEARTDTWPFGQQGIPAIHAFTGLKSPYHKPEDDADKLQYNSMKNVVLFMAELIHKLSVKDNLESGVKQIYVSKGRFIKFSTGVLGGIGNSFHQYPDEFYRAKSKLTFTGGLFAQINFGKKVSLNTEAFYDYNASFIAGSGSNGKKAEMYRNSITVPAIIQYNVLNINGIVKAYPMAGAYYRYSFSGSVDGSTLLYENNWSPEEWGYAIGFGMDIMKFKISYLNMSSLQSISKFDNIRYNGGLFRIGYTF